MPFTATIVSGTVWSRDSERVSQRESLSFIREKERHFCDTSAMGSPSLEETKPFCLTYVQEGRKLGRFFDLLHLS